MAGMDGRDFSIRPVRFRDLPTLTQMAFANMTGVDAEFTRFARHRLWRLLGQVFIPFYLLTSGRGYKAVVNGEIAGCAYLHLRELSGTAFNVNVNRPYRRQGIGRALMRHLEDQVRATGRGWIALQVDRGNEPAERLYESLHYRPYHSCYLHSKRELVLPPPRLEHASLDPLPPHEGRQRFHHFAELERREGDSWAARVLEHDFTEYPPSGGLFWRCLDGREEIGCAWQSRGERKMAVTLLLKPAYWQQPMITLGLLHLLQAQRGNQPLAFDVHFGSSSHHAAAAPTLLEMGFKTTRRARILMLKELKGGAANQTLGTTPRSE